MSKTKAKEKTAKEKTATAPFGLEWMRDGVDLLRYKVDLEKLPDRELGLLSHYYLTAFLPFIVVKAEHSNAAAVGSVRSVARFADLVLGGTLGTPVEAFLVRMVNLYYEEALTPQMINAELSKLSEEFRKEADAASRFKRVYPTQR